MTYIYEAFGYRILSEIALPELMRNTQAGHLQEIRFVYQDLTSLQGELKHSANGLIVQGGIVSFEVPDIAIFSIKHGNRVEVYPMAGADESAIRLYVLGTCMGALLQQRKVLPLHGSTVAIHGKAYTFVGSSGVGKSTLASSFLHKGYTLLSDDVTAISLSADNTPYVIPAYPQQKLWQESLLQFGKETSHYQPLMNRETKFSVPVTSAFESKPMPLAGIFEIVKTDWDDIQLQPVPLLERLPMLYQQTYRRSFITKLGLREWHFRFTTRFAHLIEAYRIYRPISQFTAYSMTEHILRTIQKEEVLQ